MRILLINPPYRAEQRYGKDMARFGPTNEPLGLAYLAGMLEAHGHDVAIWDGMVQDLKEIQDADIYGVTMLTPMYSTAKHIIESIRKKMHPGSLIVVGGAHPTVMPHETLKDIPEIDYLIQGDGEYHLLEYVEGKECPRSKDLDDLPLPARHLLPMDRYKMTRSRTKSEHAYTIIVARGCPFNCGFCSRIHGKKVRFHSVERVLTEVDLLIRDYGAKEINFEADTITVNKDFIYSLCDRLSKTGLRRKMKWTCESRVDTVSPGMVKLMKASGCWQISYGVETGTQRLLDLIQKGTRIEQIERTFAFTKKAGLSIRAFYMLGLPTETPEETQATIDFAKKLDARWSQFTLYTPFPGTALWDIANAERKSSMNWDDYRTHAGWTSHRPAWTPKGRSADEMKAAQKRAYRKVYLRPKTAWKFAKEIRSLDDFKGLFQGFTMLCKTALPKSNLIRVDADTLSALAWGNHVDSPVYFNAIWPVRELNWRKLGALIGMMNGEKGVALDMACGNGVLLPSLAQIFDRVIGLDIHTEAARELVRHELLKNVDIITVSAYELPLSDNSVDSVFATSCLEHFKYLYLVEKEIKRVLKPGGKLFFLSPTESWFYRLGRLVFGYTKPEDHYFTACDIEQELNGFFECKKAKSYPAIAPIYRMGVYQKHEEKKA